MIECLAFMQTFRKEKGNQVFLLLLLIVQKSIGNKLSLKNIKKFNCLKIETKKNFKIGTGIFFNKLYAPPNYTYTIHIYYPPKLREHIVKLIKRL